MNIRRKVFSSISENDIVSEIEERAFAEGYAKGYDAGDVARYNEEERQRKKRRIGGHVMGALGTAGLITHGAIVPLGIHQVGKAVKSRVQTAADQELAERGLKLIKAGNACLGLSAAALTAGGLYRINKAKNKKRSFEEWAAEQEKNNNNE